VAAPFAQRTRRVIELVCLIGHAAGGHPGERLIDRFAMPASDDTILRQTERKQGAEDLPAQSSLRVVGIDDWAWRKGQSYGTILVDLERRTVIDLLPDRSAASAAAWLALHPGIEIVSRDRCGLYADAARRGAPKARQVADRFPLLQNLREAIARQLSRIGRPLTAATADNRGKTPVLTADQALIAVMTYTFARVSAVVAMRVEDYFANGKRWWVRLDEKGGKRHEMPAHHKLEAYLDDYIKASCLGDEPKSPLFRSAVGRTGTLTAKGMNRIDAYRMIQRRAAALGLEVRIGCHTFRATGITAYLEAGGTLENAQAMAAHESPRTTKLYDRTGDEITLDEVERIAI